jgi:hypothetical protein
MSAERERAKAIANKILDDGILDPDADLSVLARQLLRALEALDAEFGEAFEVTEETKAILRAKAAPLISDDLMNEFFALWETENDSRKAGSIIAHRLVLAAARIAIFGTRCAGRKPLLDMWAIICEQRGREAAEDVAKAFDLVDEEQRRENDGTRADDAQ